jgi:hypothetical protein
VLECDFPTRQTLGVRGAEFVIRFPIGLGVRRDLRR